jgi:hypothetical protein
MCDYGGSMARPPELVFDFVSRYEVSVLERIARGSDYARVLSFPDAVPVDPQRELSDGVILGVRPAEGEPWIGVFEFGSQGSPPAAPRQVLGWPDEHSLCVVQRGVGCIVRTDDPAQNAEVECWPICDVLVVPDHELVVFADLTSLIAYDRDGIAWRSGRLAWDEVRMVAAEGDELKVAGFDPTRSPRGSHPIFTVDLRTGRSADKPYPDRK